MSPDAESAGLVIDDVSVRLGGRLVLDGASLRVEAGEMLGLLGPNGAGKTTLVRAILGLVRPESGSVRLGARRVRLGRSPIGYVPQRHEFAWDYPISVGDAVMTGLTGRLGLLRRAGADDWRAVAEAVERVRMTELVDRPIGQLSGGQRQRVLVARALAVHPTLLLLDEPFTGLDMPTQELLSELFVSLSREGRAVLMTTHDIVGALDQCDRIALLNRRVVAEGPPAVLAEDREAWKAAYSVGDGSAMLRVLKVAT